MSTPKALRIGTRGSELALWQAQRVAALLSQRCQLTCQLVVVHTSGDRDRSRALHELPGSGFFTKELQEALLEGQVDAVVHSLKDLPTQEPEGLLVGAVCLREDPSELLLARPEALGEGALGLRAGAVVGTSSLRRRAQVLALQPDLQVRPLRGNVPTRLRKLREGAYDAVLLAYAGVHRLGLDLSGLAVRKLPPEVLLPAPGQGALAVEVRQGDREAQQAIAQIHEPLLAEEVAAERQLLVGLGGGCHLPLGAYCQRQNGSFLLKAAYGILDSSLGLVELKRARALAPTPREAASQVLQAFVAGGSG
ncbi:MAG: hydroxymethylbilane synthase [Thermoanaerobaculum sp.]|nr:hydroxymethylbilane synthase [Thermoanaerobaculum sp.]MDW7968338.1 hydroxymethylbilane synthase [Thermoanaerobaculum sp.]